MRNNGYGSNFFNILRKNCHGVNSGIESNLSHNIVLNLISITEYIMWYFPYKLWNNITLKFFDFTIYTDIIIKDLQIQLQLKLRVKFCKNLLTKVGCYYFYC